MAVTQAPTRELTPEPRGRLLVWLILPGASHCYATAPNNNLTREHLDGYF